MAQSKVLSVSEHLPDQGLETTADPDDLQLVTRLSALFPQLRAELHKSIIGQDDVIEQLLISLLAGGHCMLVGVPGLAKTLMVRSLAETLGLSFNRVQFTPDLMPADITGTEVMQEDRASGQRDFRFIEGPIFANVVLADEINRTPPKTQAALLEAMQEHQVTAGGKRHLLPYPFFVLATQNPIEQEGTYPLPEAQLDRFMFQVLVDYPDEESEFQIVRQTTAGPGDAVREVLSYEDLAAARSLVRRIPVADHVIRHAMQFARLTRRGQDDTPDFITSYVSWGAGPRASQYLVLGAKARALLQGRTSAGIQDVEAVATPALRHRIITNFNAEADGITPDGIVVRLSKLISANSANGSKRGRLPEVFRSADTL